MEGHDAHEHLAHTKRQQEAAGERERGEAAGRQQREAAAAEVAADELEKDPGQGSSSQSYLHGNLEISNREKEGQLDEGFLSEVNAQLRQAKEDGDKPGLLVMLQKVMQLYASNFLQKRSYAYKGGEVVVPEKFLESIIQAPENDWNKLLLDELTVGKGDVSPEELFAVIKKRIERILIRTEGGSYQQRVLVEYIKEIQARAEEIVKGLQGPTA